MRHGVKANKTGNVAYNLVANDRWSGIWVCASSLGSGYATNIELMNLLAISRPAGNNGLCAQTAYIVPESQP